MGLALEKVWRTCVNARSKILCRTHDFKQVTWQPFFFSATLEHAAINSQIFLFQVEEIPTKHMFTWQRDTHTRTHGRHEVTCSLSWSGLTCRRACSPLLHLRFVPLHSQTWSIRTSSAGGSSSSSHVILWLDGVSCSRRQSTVQKSAYFTERQFAASIIMRNRRRRLSHARHWDQKAAADWELHLAFRVPHPAGHQPQYCERSFI